MTALLPATTMGRSMRMGCSIIFAINSSALKFLATKIFAFVRRFVFANQVDRTHREHLDNRFELLV